MLTRLFVGFACVVAASCSSEPPVELLVELRSDLVAGLEVDRYELTIANDTGEVVHESSAPIAHADALTTGRRIAELAGPLPSRIRVAVTVSLRGAYVAERVVSIARGAGVTAVVVLITRSCADVRCPRPTDPELAISCVRGVCVQPECVRGTEIACGASECVSAADCGVRADCADPACSSGTCLFVPDDTTCTTGAWCHPIDGCVAARPLDGSVVDSGLLDGGARDGAATDASGTDASVDGGSLVDLPGEDPVLPPGWRADVWMDFSARYTFDPAQYNDRGNIFNNRPHHMFLLSSPFAPGIGLVATWEVFELSAPDAFSSHFYYPGSSDAGGPDALWDAAPCDGFMGGPGICVGSASQGSGDGIYRIDRSWVITQAAPENNVGDLAFDPTGSFDGVGTPTLYWGDPNGLRRFGEPTFHSGSFNGAFTEILPSSDILTILTDTLGIRRLVLLRSGAHTEVVIRAATTPPAPGDAIARQHSGSFATVTGEVALLGGVGHAIVATEELIRIEASGAANTIGHAGPGWRWTHGLVPPAAHPLGADGPALYILELQPSTETNRIIRLRPP